MINPNSQSEMQALAVGLAVHIPRRGDAVEAWLKAQRDEHRDGDRVQWHILDNLLDAYRLHADTGTPLHEHACWPHCDCEEK